MTVRAFFRNTAVLFLLLINTFYCSTLFAQNLGQLDQITVYGPSLEGNLSKDNPERNVLVYLPPGYNTDSEKQFPVVYLLHGYTDTERNWFGLDRQHFVNVPDAVDAAWRTGAGEMIIVMPNAYTRFKGSMYSNSVTTGDWESYIAKDLVAYIDANYRTIPERASRGLAGHSMGGYGTMRIGMKYPDVFAALYAMSPCCMGANITPSQEQFAKALATQNDEQLSLADFGTSAMMASAAVWSPNPDNPPFYIDLPYKEGELQTEVVARWVANAPLVMLHQYIPQLKSFEDVLIDAGDSDVGIAATVVEMSSMLNAYGVVHRSEIYEGNHVSGIHERITSHLMRMFTEVLVSEYAGL
ncbi:MAG: alpha/beta hydrolase [Pseudomonadales bacterium]